MKISKFLMASLLLVSMAGVIAQAQVEAAPLKEKSLDNYLLSIKDNKVKLLQFVQSMPKGADLHNHIGGAAYAENLLSYGEGEGFCIDANSFTATQSDTCDGRSVDELSQDPNFRDQVIDAWSMRGFGPGTQQAHDHFFDSFDKFGAINSANLGDVLTEIVNRAGSEHLNYLELMETWDHDASGQLGKKLGWNSDFDQMRQALFDNGLQAIIDSIPSNIEENEAHMFQSLDCDSSTKAKPGCQVTVRYLYQVLRDNPPEQVFAQLLTGFASAASQSKVVGINMVQPEDGTYALGDYQLQMQMIDYLHKRYPDVHISLHAGELNDIVASKADLSFHIEQAVKLAHAERIGHGVDIAQEDNYLETLKTMADKQVMVEINLTSNRDILGVEGDAHPLKLYMKYGVPVALSTDDEGILRSNIDMEYAMAVSQYDITYSQLKQMTRNSLNYSFLPGKSLWADAKNAVPVSVCLQDDLAGQQISKECQQFLASSEKARIQWKLEQQLANFESNQLHSLN